MLGLKRVGRRENFFDLGGNSLQGTQIVSRLRSLFGVEVSLADFFMAPTVVKIAELVERGLRRRSQERDALFAVLAELEEGDGSGTSASAWQVRLWESWKRDPAGTMAHMPLVLRLRGHLEPHHLISSIQTIIRRHDALRTGFREEADRVLLVVEPAADLDVPLEDWSTLPPDERQNALRQAARAEATVPFDLTRPPLMRARLIKLAPDGHGLLLNMHHAVYDGWSGGIFFGEMAALYNAACAGRPATLPEPKTRYADFARWQREWLRVTWPIRSRRWLHGRAQACS